MCAKSLSWAHNDHTFIINGDREEEPEEAKHLAIPKPVIHPKQTRTTKATKSFSDKWPVSICIGFVYHCYL